MTWLYLSHVLSTTIPAYGGGSPFQSQNDKNMEAGDSCNTQIWRLSNHAGTHVDAPRHFSRSGKTISSYREADWAFEKPVVIDIAPIEPGQIVGVRDIEVKPIPTGVDLLLIKTGFGSRRNEPEYARLNPGFEPELADWLRKKFPDLRMLGFDCLSVSSYAHRDIGRAAHRAFLENERPLLLLEDADLHAIDAETHLESVLVVPLQVLDADAAPCTVLAWLND